jgi:hypothetical protein
MRCETDSKSQGTVLVKQCPKCRDDAFNRGAAASRESTSHQQEHEEIMREVTHS